MWRRRAVNTLLSCALITFSIQSSACAAVVTTPAAAPAPAQLSGDAPDPLALRLQSLGVAPDAARMRVRRLTPEERAAMQQSLDRLPAGGDTLGALTFIGLVLLITDLLGLTEVYPFVTHTVNGAKPAAAAAGVCPPAASVSARP